MHTPCDLISSFFIHCHSHSDEQDRILCAELYNLLGTDGKKQEVTEGLKQEVTEDLKQEVMTATITKVTGKSVKTLLNY